MRVRYPVLAPLVLTIALAACSSPEPAPPGEAAPEEATPTMPTPEAEATSLLGQPLVSPPPTAERLAAMEGEQAAAKADYDRNPDDADAIIWLGRRTAYLGRYNAAIDIFSEGIAKHPEDARMYRHRGHRYLTTRRIDQAIADFERAASLVEGQPDEVEPDGQPNARNIPTSTLQSNIWYHLGLGRYVKGDFAGALDAYRRCMDVSKNPDMQVATAYWLYMTLRRLGQDAEAAAVLEPITADLDVIENASYHRLLMLFKGEETPESILGAEEEALGQATTAYGIGNWHYINGRQDEGMAVFRRIVNENPTQWAAFGYLAAEAELARAGAQP